MNTPSPNSSSSSLFLQAKPWLTVLALLVAATGGSFWLDHEVSLTSQAMLYVLAVVVASYRLGLLPSTVMAVAAVTAFNFFFVPPRWTFAVDGQENVIALAVMLLVALVTSRLSTSLRQETQLAQLNATRAQQLAALASALSGANATQEVEALAQKALDAAFGGPVHLAIGEPANTEWADGMRRCIHETAALGPGTGRWPGLNAWYLPLASAGQNHGAICIQNVSAADGTGLDHALALAAITAQALWHLKLNAAMVVSKVEAERQQVQSTFLAAISHDLRTPLASVVGAASALQTQWDRLGAPERQSLLESIVNEARYLSTVTENTLQLVQLTNAAVPPPHAWESVEEIVGAVLARVRLRGAGQRIHAQVPEGLPLIQADPVLLAQLLTNLLDNALKYSSGRIDLDVALGSNPELAPGMAGHGSALTVSVQDQGPTIAVAQVAAIFEPYARSDRSGQRGAGLGLALCRAIAQVHGGTVHWHPRQGGGNRFTFTLPISAEPPRLVSEPEPTTTTPPGEAP